MKKRLEQQQVVMSAPCRLDFGGTLDISTFFFPLRHLSPTTFNIALSMRTTVTLSPWISGNVRISSRGFETVSFDKGTSPYNHPLGLMLSICDYFDAHGLHIDIRSSSPPRSALGGSSVAAVALIGALMTATGETEGDALPLDHIVRLAYAIESSVLRVPCGMQDQLAAAFGGVNAWRFTGDVMGPPYERKVVVEPSGYKALESRILAAYCGDPHESVNINGKWVNHFMTGSDRGVWKNIIASCTRFAEALAQGDYNEAALLMNQETELRLKMTPDVLDATGKKLAGLAREKGCGARFTGAGGGGCVWAVGEAGNIKDLKAEWAHVISETPQAGFLDTTISSQGLEQETGQ
ncbi:MAG: galactokinase [Proteobacteria bacterium]|nr:galactokinase [Pseudomonadota bacterium]